MLTRPKSFPLPSPLATGSVVAASLAVSLSGCANAPGSMGKLAVKPAYHVDHGGQVVHVHSYALDGTTASNARTLPALAGTPAAQPAVGTEEGVAYRYFTASVNGSGLPSADATVASN